MSATATATNQQVVLDDDPPRYRWAFSLADQAIIDAMDDATRDVVERYARSFGVAPAAPPGKMEESQLDDLADRIADNLDFTWEIRRAVRDEFKRMSA